MVGSVAVLDNMQIRNIIVIAIVYLSLVACSSDNEVTPVDYGYDYFPLEIGLFKHYDVLEVNYNSEGGDTSRYQLREYIFDTITTSSEITYLIERSKRSTVADSWVVDSIWSARSNDDYAVVTENNVTYQKISFPVQDSLIWDGHTFNTLDPRNYSMTFIDADTSQSEYLKVIIRDIPENLVLQDQRFEIYARDIGLIEKDYITLNFCTTGCEFVGQVESGRILSQVLFEYGKE